MYIIKEKVLKEYITKDSLKDLKKEIQLYNKALQKINTPLDLYQVAKSLAEYSDILRNFLDTVVTNKFSYDEWRNGKGEKFDFSPVQDLIYSMSHTLNPLTLQKQKGYFDDYHTYSERLWTYAYDSFDKRRSSIYVTFSQKVKKAFDCLDEYINTWETGKAPERSKEEYTSYKGLKIKIINDEAHINAKEFEGKEKVFFNNIDLAISLMHKKHVHTDFLSKNTFVLVKTFSLDMGGEYKNYNKEIAVLASSEDMLYTLLHEIGHAYEYQVCSEQAKKSWISFYSDPKNFIYLSDSIREELYKTFYSFIQSEVYKKKYIEYKNSSYKEHDKIEFSALELYLKTIQDKDTYTLLSTILQDRRKPIYLVMHDPETLDAKEEANNFIEQLGNKSGVLYQDRIMLGNSSLYSAKNEEEAFAELFAYYMLDMHSIRNMSPLFISFFKSILAIE